MITVIVVGLALAGTLMVFSGVYWGVALIGAASIMLGAGLKLIPANPPHKGLVTIWGRRKPVIKDEGYVVLAPYFPFYYDVIQIKIYQINVDLVFEHIRCNALSGTSFQSGAAVTIKVGITWCPDDTPAALFHYIGTGTEAGVRNILRDMMAEALRQYAAQKTWEELTISGAEITQTLVKKLTNHTAQEINTPVGHPRGHPDIMGLGILITRLNVGEVVPEGGVNQAAEGWAIEEHQRRSENLELSTEMAQAKILKDAYDQIGEQQTLQECVLEIRRRKAMREGKGTIIEIPGLEGLLDQLERDKNP